MGLDVIACIDLNNIPCPNVEEPDIIPVCIEIIVHTMVNNLYLYDNY